MSEQTSASKREPGFYYVRTGPTWMTAQWTGGRWLLPGRAGDFYDHHFDEIEFKPTERKSSPQQQPDTFDPHLVCGPKQKDTFGQRQRLKDKLQKLQHAKQGQPDELAKAQERIEELRRTVEMLTSGLPVTNGADVKFMAEQAVRIKELEAALSGMCKYWEWSIGDPHFEEYRRAKKALSHEK